MNTRIFSLIIALALPVCAFAESKDLPWVTNNEGFSTGARFSAGVDWRLSKGLFLDYDAEVRINQNFSHFQKIYNNLGISYNVTDWLKLGTGGSFIMANSTDNGWRNRMRWRFDATFRYKYNRFNFSFRERLQVTHKNYDINLYQAPKNKWELKHRFKVSYNIRKSPFTPYAAVELRNTLNMVNPNGFVYVNSNGRWKLPSPSYSDVYINRLRLVAGTEYKINKKNVLDFYLVMDNHYNIDIDLNAEGKQKKVTSTSGATSYSDFLFLSNASFVGLGINYRFRAGRK